MSNLRIWYMLDNHTFAPIPNDFDKAMDALSELIVKRRETYGMLCANIDNRRVIEPLHMKDEDYWSTFRPLAEDWLRRVLQMDYAGDGYIAGLA